MRSSQIRHEICSPQVGVFYALWFARPTWSVFENWEISAVKTTIAVNANSSSIISGGLPWLACKEPCLVQDIANFPRLLHGLFVRIAKLAICQRYFG